MSTAKQWEQLATEAIADAGEWKAEARRLQAVNAEMLEALQAVFAQLDQTWDAPHRPHRNAAKQAARAAIAKATGGGK